MTICKTIVRITQNYVMELFTTSRLGTGPGPSQSAKASFLLRKRRKIKFPAKLRMESCSDRHVPGYTLYYSAGCTQPSTDIWKHLLSKWVIKIGITLHRCFSFDTRKSPEKNLCNVRIFTACNASLQLI